MKTMYEFSKHKNGNSSQEYLFFECDADAMMKAREVMKAEELKTIWIYRFKDNDACGIREFVNAYRK